MGFTGCNELVKQEIARVNNKTQGARRGWWTSFANRSIEGCLQRDPKILYPLLVVLLRSQHICVTVLQVWYVQIHNGNANLGVDGPGRSCRPMVEDLP